VDVARASSWVTRHAEPLLERLEQSFETELLWNSGKSSFAEPIRYTLSRWTALTRYVTDGRLDISNHA
jgi:transposase